VASATVTPASSRRRASGYGCRVENSTPGSKVAIVPFNTQLVPVATTAGARVVDLYSAIAMDVRDWISPYDGLHPTEAGYQEIALTWFNALRSGYEQPFASTASTRGTPRPGRVVRRRF